MEVNSTRVESAYQRLKAEILGNSLPAGFQATEQEFADHLGMSRTPVRESLIRLEADGLVSLAPRRGARVLPISADDMREIYEILTSLEPDAAARIAASKPDRAMLRPLVVATADMQRAVELEDLEVWAEADDRFHRTLLELSNNKRMTNFIGSLMDQAHRARMLTLRMRKIPARSTDDHREIVSLMLEGDAESTRTAFREHRSRAAAELLSILDDLKLPQF